MDKNASGGKGNSVTQLPIPIIGDINNRRFVSAILSGIVGGAGVGAAASLLRSYREMRAAKSDDATDDDTIVLTLPNKAAEDGYTSMRNAKAGESKITTNGSRQFRREGKYDKGVGESTDKKGAVKCSEDAGNPGPNSVGTVVANTLGLAAGGLLSYDVVSRLFDAMHERRLKRKLKASQEAYVRALSGESKRAELVNSVIAPVEHAIAKNHLEKSAGLFNTVSDTLPDYVTNVIRYPAAWYILSLLAGTGASAYVTKKVMDKEFPEEKIKKDINSPTRIVFRTAGDNQELLEGDKGKEKRASDETCAAITAMLPIYMDIVEGAPNRTLSDPYVKLAESAGTDAVGLMKMAEGDMSAAYKTVLKDPKALWGILKGTNFGLNFSKINAAHALRDSSPDTYRRAVDSAIDAHFSNGDGAGIVRKAYNSVAKAGTKAFANLGGRDFLVDHALKSASLSDVVSTDTIVDALHDGSDDGSSSKETDDPKSVVAKAKRGMRSRRSISVSAADPAAAKYVGKNRKAIERLIAKLNALGSI